MIDTLYISTVDHDWGNVKTTLLQHRNIDTVINQSTALDCHTSVEDLMCKNIDKACANARQIVLVELDENINTTNDNNFSYGRLFNELIKHKNKVKNFDCKKNFNQIKNSRPSDDAVLWIAGCSITFGTGLLPDQNTWGNLLGKKLEMPKINLAKPGTSIFWSADQILRSDIKSGDIVVWGLTNGGRIEVSKNWKFDSATVKNYYALMDKSNQYWKLDYFDSQTQTLQIIHNILHVINFCEKIGARLYLANMLDTSWVGVAFHNLKNFIDLTHDLQIVESNVKFIDVGSDNLHPGPLQHYQYFEKLYNLIKESNHGKTI